MLLFFGVWLWFAPFHGAVGTQSSERLVDAVGTGERGICTPAVIARYSVSTKSADFQRITGCQEVGIERIDQGWMLLVAAGLVLGFSKVISTRRATEHEPG